MFATWIRRIMLSTCSGLLFVVMLLGSGLISTGWGDEEPPAPGPQGTPNANATSVCTGGSVQVCRTCAQGTGYTCQSTGPPPTVTGKSWYIGSCAYSKAGPGCQSQYWDCGLNFTCGQNPVQMGNCQTFVICAQWP